MSLTNGRALVVHRYFANYRDRFDTLFLFPFQIMQELVRIGMPPKDVRFMRRTTGNLHSLSLLFICLCIFTLKIT